MVSSASFLFHRSDPNRVLTIRGGRPLSGTYSISGAKNAALPLMVSALLTPHQVTLRNVPANLDIAVLAELLRSLGATVDWSRRTDGLSVTISADRLHPARIQAELVTRMRASALLLGALLARIGEATVPMPGGDAIGLPGIDYHLDGLRSMGAQIEVVGGLIQARAPAGLRGADITLPQSSVGATENLLLAAVLARGTTIIRNAAREPEIADLAACLCAMGAKISILQTRALVVEGCAPVGGATHEVIPDRIEFGTLACAAALTDGELLLPNARLDLLGAAAPLLSAAGVEMTAVENSVLSRRAKTGIAGVDLVTRPYPGFATDLQPPAMALLSVSTGANAVTETIFEQRFRHIDELRKMGANITVHGRTALIRGVPSLQAAHLIGTDIRAAAALLIAALAAGGESILSGLDHLDRGYDGMIKKLVACGADITVNERAD
jgi:UDP-N-acetylglucosamine 1-carboxyvinyltransferase